MEQDVHEYDGAAIRVTYDVKRCIHARECVEGLPGVFDPTERPWIDPDSADADDVAAVVARCPTGALHVERLDGGDAEQTPDENTIDVVTDGPLYAHGDVEIKEQDGTVLLSDTRVAFCRCGASANKPLCDGSHSDVGFEAAGTAGARGETDGLPGGTLSVTPTQDGPLHVEGRFELCGEDGSCTAGDNAWLCRCGGSANKPYCDGSHRGIGFTSDDD